MSLTFLLGALLFGKYLARKRACPGGGKSQEPTFQKNRSEYIPIGAFGWVARCARGFSSQRIGVLGEVQCHRHRSASKTTIRNGRYPEKLEQLTGSRETTL